MSDSLQHVTDRLIEQAQERYGVGPNYARAYLDYWQRASGRSFDNLEEILSSPPPAPMWFDYAMSSRNRGRDFYRFIQPLLAGHEKRYLDVGCGFGGCLAAFAENHMDVCGIEIDPQRVELSKATCRDIQLSDGVHTLSILEEGVVDRIGTFDVITCLDVIEHVLDVPAALRKMAALLNPGGMLILEIPNKDSLHFVACDGHFNLFGITLLDRADAIEYHRRFFTFDYDVGYYFPLEYYRAQLRRLGLRSEAVISPMHPPRPLQERRALLWRGAKEHVKYLLRFSRKLPLGLNWKLHGRLAAYGTELMWRLAGLWRCPCNGEAFAQRYLSDFWTVVARKPLSREPGA